MTDANIDFRNRGALFDALGESTFDLIVIGAGITGAGVARDAASRGLSVALIEARDIASGTSSKSSKMVHGGLRYLEHGHIKLVKEAATERQILRRIAPHLARACPFVIPGRSKATLTKFKMGLWGFDRIVKVPKAERHQRWSRAELAEREPLAAVDGVVGAVVYPEFLTNDSRLTLANVRSARVHGATVVTYAPVTKILSEDGEDGKAVGVECEGALPGESLRATVKGRLVINAAGPWVDKLRAQEDSGEAQRLTLTKGIHVVLRREQMPIRNTIVTRAHDRRPVFAVPHGDVTYLGTTDTFYADATYSPTVEQDDIDYLFTAVQRAVGVDPLKTSDVIATWAGLRPLVAAEGKKPSEISRRDELWVGPRGVLSIAGGKLTAYRKMAERIVDKAVEILGAQTRPPTTGDVPLVGGDFDYDRALAEISDQHPQYSPIAATRLVDLYGAEAVNIARDAGDSGDSGDSGGSGDVAAEVRQAVRREGALTLEDYWVRRGARAWFDGDAGAASLEPAADEMARLLEWTDDVKTEQIKQCRQQHGTLVSNV